MISLIEISEFPTGIDLWRFVAPGLRRRDVVVRIRDSVRWLENRSEGSEQPGDEKDDPQPLA